MSESQTLERKKGTPRKESPATPDAPEVVKKKFRVSCHPPTPLAYTERLLEANNPDEAKEKFFALNGISGTIHTVNIAEV